MDSLLSFAEILTMAERESGAHGLADDGLIRRASGMVDWINARGPYTSDQVRRMHVQVQRLLANRLRLKLDRQRFPAIAGEKIERPLFVMGFPRSGTTLLHSLIAEDPEVQSLRSLQMYSPSPPPGAGPVVPERIAYAQRRVEEWLDFCPGQKPMHPYSDKGAWQPIEDEESFSLDFHTAYVYHYFHVPTLEPMAVPDADPVGAFSFHREQLQHWQWNTGKTRWACKGPSHQNNLDSLFKVYPDALCVWTHRKIGDVLASIAWLSHVIFETIRGKPFDPRGGGRVIAEYPQDRLRPADGQRADRRSADSPLALRRCRRRSGRRRAEHIRAARLGGRRCVRGADAGMAGRSGKCRRPLRALSLLV